MLHRSWSCRRPISGEYFRVYRVVRPSSTVFRVYNGVGVPCIGLRTNGNKRHGRAAPIRVHINLFLRYIDMLSKPLRTSAMAIGSTTLAGYSDMQSSGVPWITPRRAGRNELNRCTRTAECRFVFANVVRGSVPDYLKWKSERAPAILLHARFNRIIFIRLGISWNNGMTNGLSRYSVPRLPIELSA